MPCVSLRAYRAPSVKKCFAMSGDEVDAKADRILKYWYAPDTVSVHILGSGHVQGNRLS